MIKFKEFVKRSVKNIKAAIDDAGEADVRSKEGFIMPTLSVINSMIDMYKEDGDKSRVAYWGSLKKERLKLSGMPKGYDQAKAARFR